MCSPMQLCASASGAYRASRALLSILFLVHLLIPFYVPEALYMDEPDSKLASCL